MGRADLPRTHAGRRNPIVAGSEPQQPDPTHAAVARPTRRGSATVELPLALLAGSNASRRREDHPPRIHRPRARFGPPRWQGKKGGEGRPPGKKKGEGRGACGGGGALGPGRSWGRRERRGAGAGGEGRWGREGRGARSGAGPVYQVGFSCACMYFFLCVFKEPTE